MQEKEFRLCVNTLNLKLPPQGVIVVWEWKWRESSSTSSEYSEEEEIESTEQYNPYLHSDSANSSSENGLESSSSQYLSHTVTFKPSAQSVLCQISRMLRENQVVHTKIETEPENQYDVRAIAFFSFVDGKWQRIGYIVRECLEHVHSALSEGKIVSISLSWAKYLACWIRSGPRYYAGVNITIVGQWHQDVVRARSTR